MRFRFSIKAPDGISFTLDDWADELQSRTGKPWLECREMVSAYIAPWFSGEEYICIEIDPEEGTCVVVPK